MNDTKFDDLLGKTLIEISGMGPGSTHVTFKTSDGSMYVMFHDLQCCEIVRLIEVIGNVDDMLHSPILLAEKVTNKILNYDTDDKSGTWTFYKLATVKGYVTLRWFGSSNGYYSEAVDFKKIK